MISLKNLKKNNHQLRIYTHLKYPYETKRKQMHFQIDGGDKFTI